MDEAAARLSFASRTAEAGDAKQLHQTINGRNDDSAGGKESRNRIKIENLSSSRAINQRIGLWNFKAIGISYRAEFIRRWDFRIRAISAIALGCANPPVPRGDNKFGFREVQVRTRIAQK